MKIGTATSLRLTVGLAMFVAASLGTCTKAERPPGAEPSKNRVVWRVGTWWVTQTRRLQHEPFKTISRDQVLEFVYRHKWTVAKEDKLNNKAVWVVEVRAWDRPGDAVDDSKDEPLYRLYFDKATCGLLEADAAFCGHGKGEVEREMAKFSGTAPVIRPSRGNLPMEFPLLRWPWLNEDPERQASAYPDSSIVKDQDSERAIKQTVRWFRADTSTGELGCFVILKFNGVVSRSTWRETCPWWTEWNSAGDDFCPEALPMSSKTIDWSGRVKEAGAATQRGEGLR